MIRLMRPGDIAACMRLKEAAGWNQIDQDWANVLALEPEGCWVDEQQGYVAASTTAVCYGDQLAWIGMVLVAPLFRRRGLARGLMEHALRWLETRGVRQVKLDATDMGRPLYQTLGFREERSIERWGGSCAGVSPPAAAVPPDPGPLAAFDRQAFGADRTSLIELLVRNYPGQAAWEPGEGFALGRPGSGAYFLGPCEAVDAETAGRLIRALMERIPARLFFWDLFPDVPVAVDLARELGFERRRALARMALRPEPVPRGRPERVFAAAGFEYG